ncbi:aminopeptidase P family protein [Acuticoccus sp.]|uniref:aminopeptidase P family protein n=1 Tax=Acuticoccus sp. TaxID=1904378 RepID=UPI003B526405
MSAEEPRPSAATIGARVAALRATFVALGVDGVIVPHEDAYQSETLPPSEERLAHVTGFTGSAGRAIILGDAALFLTDGRYTLQASQQVPDLFTVLSDEASAKAWMAEHLAGRTLGVDPNLHTRADLERLATRAAGLALVRLDRNPVDAIWSDRPPAPRGAVRAHPERLAGRSAAQKVEDLRATLDPEADALYVADSDTVSWLLNWRGTDVAHTPLVLSRAFVPRDGAVSVFVDPGKVPDALRDAADGLLSLVPADDHLAHLAALSAGRRVLADPARASDAALAAIAASGTLVARGDPSVRLKAIKNAAEVEGMRAAHRRDGLALLRFLAWFEDRAVGADELSLVERLAELRKDVGALGPSFDTIAGAGPNGAIVHYRADGESNRAIAAGDPVLVDSGAQYEDGTTDVTRTLVAGGGAGSEAFRLQYTRVLRGHIAIARQLFPEGTSGAELDPLARAALWSAGSDYKHGTGHGIGAALAVHEAGAGLSKRSRDPLEAGMIVSNEPGDYRPGEFGIRIENLYLVRERRVPPGGTLPMHAFEALTLAPIDTRPVVPALMRPEEIAWLDAYHARVHGALAADLSASERAFLAERTRPMT